MRAYSEHLNRIQYIKNNIENEILWVRKVFFKDVLSNKRLNEVVDEHNIPLVRIWYKELGKEYDEVSTLKKSDFAIWELNRLNKESKEVNEQNMAYVRLRTKCPTEVIEEIMTVMDLVYMFCGRREFDSTDPECVRQYCNVYMADIVYNSNELLNKFLIPINEVVEVAKKDREANK